MRARIEEAGRENLDLGGVESTYLIFHTSIRYRLGWPAQEIKVFADL